MRIYYVMLTYPCTFLQIYIYIYIYLCLVIHVGRVHEGTVPQPAAMPCPLHMARMAGRNADAKPEVLSLQNEWSHICWEKFTIVERLPSHCIRPFD